MKNIRHYLEPSGISIPIFVLQQYQNKIVRNQKTAFNILSILIREFQRKIIMRNGLQPQDIKEIEKLIDDGYISKRKHPELDYYILNYTSKTQFDWVWNKYTMMCRGLIVDAKYNIISRPFIKFFNDDQLEKLQWQIPNESFEVFDKLDGSLGIMYFYFDVSQDNWIPSIATRGSFESEQSIIANKILRDKYSSVQWNPNFTYLFEIIAPENRIVVDYGNERKLVLLSIIKTESGRELSYDEMVTNCIDSGIEIVQRYDGIKDWRTVLNKFDDTNKEGFVIRFSSGFRVKMKFEKYKQIHRIISNLSTKSIWEMLKEGKTRNEIIENIPDEFHNWVINICNEFESRYVNIENTCLSFYKIVMRNLGKNFTKKDYAMKVKDLEYSNIYFAIYNQKDYSEIIWKMLRPSETKYYISSEGECL